ncbi:MAG: diguanylate cyclase [Archangium sp.]|nr:diguanylate cyclase [Archangium sp.]
MAQILLVDDEKVARSLYSDFLAGAGHEVTAVGSVAEAKEALAKTRFALLVTDLILPQSDGMALLQYVRSTQPDVEVLVITALDKVEPAVRAIKSGAADYLVKPVQPEVLAHAVNRALTQHTLLKENEALRTHVALLEAGQRIATTLERDHLFEATASAFQSMCAADAVVVFVKEAGGQLELASFQGFADVPREPVEKQTLQIVREAVGKIDRAGQEIAIEDLGFDTAFLVPVYEGDAMYGAVLLFFRDDISDAGVSGAPFLARHLGLALKNLGKFAAVEDLVYLDDLTHLFNSRYLQLVLDKEFKSQATNDKPFALAFLDLDYFKSINDTHGHLVGSKLLVEVARVLKNCVRDNDIVCRWGGDEYVLLLRGTDSGGALKVAERIRRSIESHRFLAREGFSLSISTCIGIASYPEHAQDQETLVDLADRAMYRGKKGTRNIIYMAAKNLEATPASRHQSGPLPAVTPRKEEG